MKKLNDHELEGKLIYAIIVAGKTADHADRTTRTFLKIGLEMLPDEARQSAPTPFGIVRRLSKEQLRQALERARTGNYAKMELAMAQLTERDINLRTCSPEELEEIHGIGPKTSRFFIAWTRPGAMHAVLDTHILRWLRRNGYPDAPFSTPPPKHYARWEKVFLAEAKKRGKTPRQLDEEIWTSSTRSRV